MWGLGPGGFQAARAGRKGTAGEWRTWLYLQLQPVTRIQLETQVSVCMEGRSTSREGKLSEGTLGSVGSAWPLECAVGCGCPVATSARVTLAPLLDSLPLGVNPREECKVQEKLYLGSCT